MKKTFCDGCGESLHSGASGPIKTDARVGLNIRASCQSSGEPELGQFSVDGLDLCRQCIDRLKSSINPREWPRSARARD